MSNPAPIERVFKTDAGVSHMLALSTDRTRLYCSNMRDGSVSAFDFKTGQKIKDVKTGKECEGVGVTPDGRWVWAGNRAEDTISIIDTKSLEVTKRIPSPGFPYRVQFTPDGRLGADPARQCLIAGDRRRGEAGDREIDSPRPDQRSRNPRRPACSRIPTTVTRS